MRTLGALVIVGFFVVAQGCSSSSGPGTTVTGGSSGGTSTAAQGGSRGGSSATVQGGSSGGASSAPKGGSSGGSSATVQGGSSGGTSTTAAGGSGGDTGTTPTGGCVCVGDTGTTATGGSSGGDTGTTSTGGSGGASGTNEGGRGGSAGGAGGTNEGGRGGGGRGGRGGATAAGGRGGAGGGTPAGGAGGASGGTGGSTTGGSGGDTGTSTGPCVCASACQLPSCLKNLGADCAPSGTCTVEDHPDTGDKNFCYGNGVKKITVLDISDYSTALTVTKAGSTCFTTAYIGNDFFNSEGNLTVNDASGATVATLAMDPDTSTHFIVTCPGADPVTLDDSCQTVWPVTGLTDQSGDTCTDGTCSP